ncbi:MAG TPA: tetratricopeptide repeat protein [Kofleriaceae bacterium]|nr:tetratricopeptide repeat protein [Kofleriaceae bacterium]
MNDAAGTANFRIQMNLGIVDAELGQLHAGLADFEAARKNAIREAADTSPHVVECEVAIAAVLTALGEYDRARPMLDRGLAEAAAARAPVQTEALYASARFALARGDSATAARRFTEYAQVNKDPSDPERAILEAEVTRAQSGCRVARSVIERTLAAVKNVPYYSERIQAAVVAARCDVELGEPVRALAELEPTLSWYAERHADIEVIAGALFAKALAVAAQGDVERARTLAERARPGLFGVARDEVMRWLAQHPHSH